MAAISKYEGGHPQPDELVLADVDGTLVPPRSS